MNFIKIRLFESMPSPRTFSYTDHETRFAPSENRQFFTHRSLFRHYCGRRTKRMLFAQLPMEWLSIGVAVYNYIKSVAEHKKGTLAQWPRGDKMLPSISNYAIPLCSSKKRAIRSKDVTMRRKKTVCAFRIVRVVFKSRVKLSQADPVFRFRLFYEC